MKPRQKSPRGEPIALVDMDGTLCDYHGAMVRDMERLRSPGEKAYEQDDGRRDPPHIKARRDLVRAQPGMNPNIAYREATSNAKTQRRKGTEAAISFLRVVLGCHRQ
ncbi:MAG: hypothetical protein HY720_30500 [Planctomycetes bacterium]|nr:hypothetical protein [Planctomycetota bacterium]